VNTKIKYDFNVITISIRDRLNEAYITNNISRKMPVKYTKEV